MEMILISPDKLKIMLLESDLEFFDLTADELDYGNTETKRMLWELLCRAKRTVGFDADGYRIFVQLYPSRDGSCELFITKISLSEASIYDTFSKEIYECDDNDLEDDSCSELNSKAESEHTIRLFEMFSLDALSDACRRLTKKSYAGESSVYILSGHYYLLLRSKEPELLFPLDELSFIGEYGTPAPTPTLLPNLFEFGNLVREGDAARIFSEI